MKNTLAIRLLIPALLLTACSKDPESDWDESDQVGENDTSASWQAEDSDEDVSDADHTINTSDYNNDFTPQDLTIAVGDTVRFVMTATHNAIEVTQETYDSRGTTPIDGGFQVTFGETQDVTFTEVGTHYYVCTPHVTMGMIGTITVE